MTNKNALMGKIVSAGYTQVTIAKALGMSKNTINAKINNRKPFDTDTVLKMCELLNIHDDSEKVDIFLCKPSQNRDGTRAS